MSPDTTISFWKIEIKENYNPLLLHSVNKKAILSQFIQQKFGKSMKALQKYLKSVKSYEVLAQKIAWKSYRTWLV